MIAVVLLLLLTIAHTPERTQLRPATKCGAGRICGLGLGLGLWFGLWLGIWLWLVLGLALGLRLLIVVYKLLEKSDKMRINHVIKTDQWRSAQLRILSCPLSEGVRVPTCFGDVARTSRLRS